MSDYNQKHFCNTLKCSNLIETGRNQSKLVKNNQKQQNPSDFSIDFVIFHLLIDIFVIIFDHLINILLKKGQI